MDRREDALGIGQITTGITPNSLVGQTILFVEERLPMWRDDSTRPYVEGEEDLNAQLCKYLNAQARHNFPMAYFHHEEKQGARRRVDLSALPTPDAVQAIVYFDSIYNPFLVLEGKRVPPPGGAAREREYVTGLADRSGGVQRFKLGLHGALHNTAVMLGYVQDGLASDWLTTMNGWIGDLEASGEDATCNWTAGDQFGPMTTSAGGVCRFESRHLRLTNMREIELIHLWVQLPAKSPPASALPA
jgi:hypothetical protein